jgi:hypothetical protein
MKRIVQPARTASASLSRSRLRGRFATRGIAADRGKESRMQRVQRSSIIAGCAGALAAAGWLAGAPPAQASDHLDTPTVIADPAADIADLFAWTSPDGRRLNLVMTIVGHRFSDRVAYAFHVDSGPRLGATSATTQIACRFDAAGAAQCWAGDADYARGDASGPAGLESRRGRFRVFAGLRDDPFFNNVKGTREALDAVAGALRGGASRDPSGCPAFDADTAHAIFDRWRHTSGGPAVNTLAGWKVSALVVSVDLDVVTTAGPVLGVWAGTYRS